MRTTTLNSQLSILNSKRVRTIKLLIFFFLLPVWGSAQLLEERTPFSELNNSESFQYSNELMYSNMYSFYDNSHSIPSSDFLTNVFSSGFNKLDGSDLPDDPGTIAPDEDVYNALREVTPLKNAILFICLICFIYMAIVLFKNKWRINAISKKAITLLLFCIFFANTLHAQDAITIVNPTNDIVMNGNASPFGVEINNLTAGGYTDLKLEITLGTGWTYVSNSAAYSATTVGSTVTLALPNLAASASLPLFNVFLSADCGATNTNPIVFELINGAAVVMVMEIGVLDLQSSVLRMTTSGHMVIGRDLGQYRTLTLTEMNPQAYMLAGDSINVTFTAGYGIFTITEFQYMSKSTGDWRNTSDLTGNVFVEKGEGSYTYYLTAELLQDMAGGNGDNKLDPGESLQLREHIQYTECNYIARRLTTVYTPQFCGRLQDGSTNLMVHLDVNDMSNYGSLTYVPQMTSPARRASWQPGGVSSERGIITLAINSSYPIVNSRILVFSDRGTGNPTQSSKIKVLDAYISDASGNPITGPTLDVKPHWAPYHVVWEGDTITFPNGFIIDQLTYVTYVWEIELHLGDPSGCHAQILESMPMSFRLESQFSCSGGKTIWLPRQGSEYRDVMELLWFKESAFIEKQFIAIGEQTNLIVNERIWIGMPAFTDANSTSAIHQLQVQIPSDLKFANHIEIHSTPNSGKGSPFSWVLNPADWSYDAGTNVLTFKNMWPDDGDWQDWNNTIRNSYYIRVEGVTSSFCNPDPVNNVVVSHLFDYTTSTGTEKWTHNCFSYEQNYYISGGSGSETCAGIFEVTGIDINRTSYGYVSFSDLTPIANDAAAMTLGVDRRAVGPYDNVVFSDTISKKLEPVWKKYNNQELYVQFFYLSTNNTHFFTDQGEPYGAQIIYNGGSTIDIPAGKVTYSVSPGYGHYITVEISDYLAALDGVSASEFVLDVFARVAGTVPQTVTPLIRPNSSIYWESEADESCICNKGFFGNFRVWDYKMTVQTGVRDGELSHSKHNVFSIFDFQVLGSDDNEFFPNEYRPNLVVTDASLLFNMLIEVDELITYAHPYGKLQTLYHLSTSFTTPGVDVSTTGTTTRIDLNNQYLLSYEHVQSSVFSIAIGGGIVCAPNGWLLAEAKYLDYPTSANPVNRQFGDIQANAGWIQKASGNSSSGQYNYSVNVTPSDEQVLSTDSAEWVFEIYNDLQTWGGSGDLPNFWIGMKDSNEAFDMTKVKFYDYTTGVQIPSVHLKDPDNPYNIFRLGKIQTQWGVLKKILIKAPVDDCSFLGTTIDFLSSCNYVAEITPVATVEGSGDLGLVFADFNNRPICNIVVSSSGRVVKIPTVIYTVTTDDSKSKNLNNKLDFCDSIVVAHTFINNSEVQGTNMTVEITLPAGLALDETDVKMFRGNAPWAATDIESFTPFNGTIDQTGSTVLFTFDDSEVLSLSSDATNRFVTLVYDVTPECGYRSGSVIRATMSVKNTCGDIVIQKTSTGPLNIDFGGISMPVITFDGTQSIDNNVINMTSASYETITLSGQVNYSANPSAVSGMQVILPGNMTIVSGAITAPDNITKFNFAQSNDTLTARFSANDATLAVTGIYSYSVEVQLNNPENWDCDDYDITVLNFVDAQISCPSSGLTCGIVEILSEVVHVFTVVKNDIEIDASSVSFTEKAFGDGTSRITVKATVNNNTAALQNTDLYVYAGTAQATNTVAIPAVNIPANGSLDINYVFESEISEICNLRLVMPKLFTCNSDTVDVVVGYDLSGNDTICQASNLLLGDAAITGYTYTWSTVSGLGLPADKTTPQITFNFPGSASLKDENQTQTISLAIRRGSDECIVNATKTIHVVPTYSIWEGNAGSLEGNGDPTDWNNVYNWSNGIPDKCTDVLIPDGRTYYPVLQTASPTYRQATCNKITFEHGGEIQYPFYLDYVSAEVHMTVNNGRWWMVAPPLRDMYSGDYYDKDSDPMLTSRPRVYMQIYQAENPEDANLGAKAAAQWSNPFNTADVPLGLGTGAITWTMNNPAGSFIFPSRHISSGGYQSGSYAIGDLIKQYKYFSKDDGVTFMNQWSSVLTRTNADRFIYESSATANSVPVNNWYGPYNSITYNPNFTVSVTNGDTDYPTVLVGNPYMSHLDFDEFYNQNSANIEEAYYIWNGSSFDADNTGTIAPLQSFILAKESTPNTITLNFNEAMSVVSSGSKLKSPVYEKSLVVDVLRNNERHSSTKLVFDEEASPMFDKKKDAYTLFHTEEVKPAVLFSIKQEEALSIQTTNFEELIELGIRTTEKGLLTLQFSGWEYFDNDLYLYDYERKSKQNLRKKDTYVFSNLQGNVRNRFYLMLDKTGIEMLPENEISVWAEQNLVSIYSTVIIESVKALNTQGQTIYKQDKVQEANHEFALPAQAGVYLIQVTLTDGEIQTRKIIVK